VNGYQDPRIVNGYQDPRIDGGEVVTTMHGRVEGCL